MPDKVINPRLLDAIDLRLELDEADPHDPRWDRLAVMLDRLPDEAFAIYDRQIQSHCRTA